MDTIHQLIRFNLRRIRRAKDLTQLELAERAGFSPHAIQRIESGQRQPKLSTIAILCEALGVSELELLALENQSEVRVPQKIAKKKFSKAKNELLNLIEKADERTVDVMLAHLKYLSALPKPNGSKSLRKTK